MMNRLFSWFRSSRARITIHGAIHSVDSEARTILLSSGAENLEVLQLDARAKVMKADQEIPLEDLYVGEKLAAFAAKAGDGKPVAESVRIIEE